MSKLQFDRLLSAQINGYVKGFIMVNSRVLTGITRV